MSLYDENLAALKPFLSPEHYDFLHQKQPCGVEILPMNPDGSRTNLFIEGQAYYQPDAETVIAGQLAEYFRKPTRVNLAAPNYLIPFNSMAALEKSRSGHFLKNQLRCVDGANFLGDHDLSGTARSGFAVIMGLGTGRHVEALVDKLDCRHFVICDYYIDFLQASLDFTDWVGIASRLREKRASLKFLMSDDQKLLAIALSTFLREKDIGLLPGSYFYPHYDLDPELKLYRSITLEFNNIKGYNGWAEDEAVHLRNICGNFGRVLQPAGGAGSTPGRTFSFIAPSRRQGKTEKPVVVAGSGPSLAAFIPSLREQRERLVLVSAGTSLKPLIEAGLCPDFHFELENTPMVVDQLATIDDPNALKTATLVASVSVDPRVCDMFGTVCFFNRTGDMVLHALRPLLEPFPESGGTAVNSALNLCLTLRPPAIFLSGVDYAYSDDGDDHVKNVAYNHASWTAKHQAFIKPPNSLTIPGNDGQDVRTTENWAFMLSLTNRLLMQGHPETAIYNCGKGAAIVGADPVLDTTHFRALLDRHCPIDEEPVEGGSSCLQALNHVPFGKAEISAFQANARTLLRQAEELVFDVVGIFERGVGGISSVMTPAEQDRLMVGAFEASFERINAMPPEALGAAMLIREECRYAFHVLRQYFVTHDPEKSRHCLEKGFRFLCESLIRMMARFHVSATQSLGDHGNSTVERRGDAGRLFGAYKAWWAKLACFDTVGVIEALEAMLPLLEEPYWAAEETIAWYSFRYRKDRAMLNPLLDFVDRTAIRGYVTVCPHCGGADLKIDNFLCSPAQLMLSSRCQTCAKTFFTRQVFHTKITPNMMMSISNDNNARLHSHRRERGVLEEFVDLYLEYSYRCGNNDLQLSGEYERDKNMLKEFCRANYPNAQWAAE